MTVWRGTAFQDGFYQGLSAFPICEIVPSATDYVRLFRFHYQCLNPSQTGAAYVYGLGVSGTVGVGPRALFPLVCLDQNFTGVAPSILIASSWTTPPANPTNWHRRTSITYGTAGMINQEFIFPQGLSIKPTQSIIFAIITDQTALGVTHNINSWVTAEFHQ